jgi:hypothetical protein
MYKIYDESDNELTGGEIESYTCEYFQNKEWIDQMRTTPDFYNQGSRTSFN